MKNKIIFIFFFLYILSMLVVVLDYTLSEKALSDGYYETNKFSNEYGLYLHLTILLFTLFSFLTFFIIMDKLELGIIFYLMFTVIWLINNIISLVLLYG